MYSRYWLVSIEKYGFEGKMLVYGTEHELQEYLSFELGVIPSYSGASEEEVKLCRKLHIKAYICPPSRQST